MILDIEQVRVRGQGCRSLGIALEPAPRGEDRGGNPVLNQKAHQVRVERAAACVKGERDNVLAWTLRKIEALMQLDRMLRRDGSG